MFSKVLERSWSTGRYTEPLRRTFHHVAPHCRQQHQPSGRIPRISLLPKPAIQSPTPRKFHVSHFNNLHASPRLQRVSKSTQQNEGEYKMATKTSDDHYLTLSCPDKSGIVYAVTGLLAA